MRRRLAAATAASLLFAVVSLRLWERSIGANFSLDFLNWDLLCEFYPHLEHTARVYGSGIVPLWNPEEHCGYPHLAGAQTGVLYPPYVLFWLWPGFPAAVAIHAFHLCIAGLGGHFLARRLGATPGSAWLCFVLAAFSSQMALGAFMTSRAATLAWGPFCLLATVVESPLGVAAAFALAFLGGYVPYAVFIAVSVVLTSMGLAILARRLRPMLRAIIGIGLGVMLGAAVGIPVLELWTQADRSRALVDATRSGDALGLGDAAQLFVADPGQWPWLFLGALGVVFVLAGATSRRGAPLGVVAAIAALYLLGRKTPAYGLFASIPPFSSFRGVRAAIPMIQLTAPALAALGLDRLAPLAASRPRATAFSCLGVAVVVAWAGLALGWVAGPCLFALELAVVGGGLLLSGPRSLAPVIVALTFLRLLGNTVSLPPYATKYRPLLEPDARASAELAAIYPGRIATNIGRPRAELPGSIILSMAGGAIPIVRAGGHPRSLPLARIEELTARLAPAAMGTLRDPLPFSLLACPYAVVSEKLVSRKFPSAGLREADRFLSRMGQKLVRNPVALPRAAVIEGGKEYAEGIRTRPAKIVSFGPTVLDVDLDGGPAGFLVLAEAYYPGWLAWVDGKPANVEPANTAFRAIEVPASARRVHLAYRPVSFLLGLFLSSISLSLCLCASVLLTFNLQNGHKILRKLSKARHLAVPSGATGRPDC